jgi:hypothetical protein
MQDEIKLCALVTDHEINESAHTQRLTAAGGNSSTSCAAAAVLLLPCCSECSGYMYAQAPRIKQLTYASSLTVHCCQCTQGQCVLACAAIAVF